MADQLGGHAEDALRAAIVAFQAYDVNVGIIVLEFENVVQIAHPPAVDRLVRVAGDGQIGIFYRQRPGDGVLGEIGVLIFIDEDVAIAVVEALADFSIFAQQRRDVQEQVVEVGGIGG